MWENVLYEAASEARERLLATLSSHPRQSSPSAQKRIGDQLDYVAEQAIEEVLRRRGVKGKVLSENREFQLTSESDTWMVIDPVDGTNNLARRCPPAAVSIAVCEGNRLDATTAGLIMNIYTGECYYAVKGKGAFSGSRRLSTSITSSIQDGLISIDVSKRGDERLLSGILGLAKNPRQIGSASMSLALVADGVFDAYIDLRGLIRVTDVAAGLLIVKEAGGVIHVQNESLYDVEIRVGRTLSLIGSANQGILNEILSALT